MCKLSWKMELFIIWALISFVDYKKLKTGLELNVIKVASYLDLKVLEKIVKMKKRSIKFLRLIK